MAEKVTDTGTEQETQPIIDPASLAKGLDEETPVIETPVVKETPGSTEGTFTPNQYWDDVSKKYGTEETPFELPEEIKTGKLEEGKTEFDYFLDEVNKRAKETKTGGLNQTVEDPLMQDYLTAKATEGFNEVDWLRSKTQQVDVLGLPSKKFIEFYLTQTNGKTEENPDGYTTEDISVYIEGKNKIELDREAIQYKQNYSKYLEDYRKQQITVNQEKHKGEFEKAETANKKIITDYLTKNKTDRSFYGIELSESEYVQFEKDAIDLFKQNPETGMNKFTEQLQSDEFALSLIPLILLGEAKFKAKISGIKEDLKTNLEKSLGTGPRVSGGDVAQPDQFDPGRLT